jgi:hypothetical protein
MLSHGALCRPRVRRPGNSVPEGMREHDIVITADSVR